MPIIERLGPITVRMYLNDHAPPHIHVLVAEQEAMVDVRTGDVIAGELERRHLRRVQAWLGKERERVLSLWREFGGDDVRG